MGGVIDIVTKTGEGPPRLTGRVEGGSFDTFNQTAGVSGGRPLQLRLQFEHFIPAPAMSRRSTSSCPAGP